MATSSAHSEQAEPRGPAESASWSGTARGHLGYVLAYVALAVVFFWPVVSELSTRVLADRGDGAAFLWNLWFIPQALLHGQNPFVTDAIFYPIGARTALNTNVPLLSVLSWPISQSMGLGVAANTLQLFAVISSGVGAYLLALHQCGNRRASFVAGVAFSYLPYRFAHLPGHFNLNHTEFLPFGVLALLRLYDYPTPARALVLGFVVGLTFLTDLTYTVFLLIALIVVAFWRRRQTFTRCFIRRLAQAAGTALLVSLPLAIPIAWDVFVLHELDPLVGWWGGADAGSSDLLSWFVPSSKHPIWGVVFRDLSPLNDGERMAFPGYTVWVLALSSLALDRKGRSGLWTVLAGVFIVLSLGPYLHVLGRTGQHFEYLSTRFSVPLPYALLHFVPVLNWVRVPGRFSIMGALALAVLAAIALARLAERKHLTWLAPLLALSLVLVEFLPPPAITFDTLIPDPYLAIAADPSPGAVLEIPIEWRTGLGGVGDPRSDTIYLYYATAHRRPVVSGMVARYPQRKVESLFGVPLYRQVLALQGEMGFEDPPQFSWHDLNRLGIRFVVLHREHAPAAPENYLSTLRLPVLADNGDMVVWKVPDLRMDPDPAPPHMIDARDERGRS